MHKASLAVCQRYHQGKPDTQASRTPERSWSIDLQTYPVLALVGDQCRPARPLTAVSLFVGIGSLGPACKQTGIDVRTAGARA